MKTVSILLTNGAEWIAQQQETLDSNTVLSLTKVRKLHIMPQQGGGVGMALIPVLMSNNDKEDFELDHKHVVVVSTPHPDFEKQYLTEVSGIQLI